MKPHTNWKLWDRGWGYDLELAPGVKLTVSKGHSAKDGFRYAGLNRRSKTQYETAEEAMIMAEKMAASVLRKALDTLLNTKPMEG